MKTGLYVNEESAVFIVSKYFNVYIVETQSNLHQIDRHSLELSFTFNNIKFLGEL